MVVRFIPGHLRRWQIHYNPRQFVQLRSGALLVKCHSFRDLAVDYFLALEGSVRLSHSLWVSDFAQICSEPCQLDSA